MTHRLETTISDALWAAIQARAQMLGQPTRQVVQEALAEALDLDHHSMFQVSTSGALVEGLYRGALTVGEAAWTSTALVGLALVALGLRRKAPLVASAVERRNARGATPTT